MRLTNTLRSHLGLITFICSLHGHIHTSTHTYTLTQTNTHTYTVIWIVLLNSLSSQNILKQQSLCSSQPASCLHGSLGVDFFFLLQSFYAMTSHSHPTGSLCNYSVCKPLKHCSNNLWQSSQLEF